MTWFYGVAMTVGLMAGSCPLPVAAAVHGLAQGSDDLYWIGSDQKRYLFPSQDGAFTSWLFRIVDAQVVQPAELAKYPLAGIVHFRPGGLASVATSNQMYAVAQHGVLHPVTDKAVANELFPGLDLNALPKIGVAQFTNYHVGSAIEKPSDFQPVDVVKGVKTPDDDPWFTAQQLAANDKVFAGKLTLTVTKGSDGINVAHASIIGINSPTSSITLVLTNQSNIPLRTCMAADACDQALVGDYAIGTSSVIAKATNELGQVLMTQPVAIK